jgi:hypothetical protein
MQKILYCEEECEEHFCIDCKAFSLQQCSRSFVMMNASTFCLPAAKGINASFESDFFEASEAPGAGGTQVAALAT